ncbi:MAG TPA: alginate export family protein [Prolixibacteraceae bacterium]|nr:alginate export family protein [Prolixibacteraceae bacterium]
MKRIFSFLSIMVFAGMASLNAQIQIDAEYRPRMIIDNGYKNIKKPDDPVLVSISQRTRLNVGFRAPKLETYLSVQDVRFWGDDDNYSSSGMLGNTKSLSVHQAWFALKPLNTISFKIGRQQFNYDDQRILAQRSWNDYQVTYDAILFAYQAEKQKLDVALSWNTSGMKNDLFPAAKMKMFDFIRYEYTLGDLSLSALSAVTGFPKSDTLSDLKLTGTSNLGIVYKHANWDARFYGYYQYHLNTHNEKIDAYMFSFWLKRKMMDGKLLAGLGLDFYSGEDGTSNDPDYRSVNHSFNPFYGISHGRNGYMDLYAATPEQGLQDWMLKAEYYPNPDIRLQLDFHHFRNVEHQLATDGLSVLDKSMGSELDFTLYYKIIDAVTLQAGYSFYVTTPAFERYKKYSGETNPFLQFGYVMCVVKPRLL